MLLAYCGPQRRGRTKGVRALRPAQWWRRWWSAVVRTLSVPERVAASEFVCELTLPGEATSVMAVLVAYCGPKRRGRTKGVRALRPAQWWWRWWFAVVCTLSVPERVAASEFVCELTLPGEATSGRAPLAPLLWSPTEGPPEGRRRPEAGPVVAAAAVLTVRAVNLCLALLLVPSR